MCMLGYLINLALALRAWCARCAQSRAIVTDQCVCLSLLQVNKLWEWTRVPHVPVELKAFLPMTGAVRITLGHGVQMITFVNTVPIDEHTSINRFCLIRNFAIDPAMDLFVRENMMTILTEDKVSCRTHTNPADIQ